MVVRRELVRNLNTRLKVLGLVILRIKEPSLER
jgi:hypothetical protein